MEKRLLGLREIVREAVSGFGNVVSGKRGEEFKEGEEKVKRDLKQDLQLKERKR